MILEHDSPMIFGKFKGTPMKDVPADYILYLYDKIISSPYRTGKFQGTFLMYVNENREYINERLLKHNKR